MKTIFDGLFGEIKVAKSGVFGFRNFLRYVMRMAGHSSFEMPDKFYMGIDSNFLERTRQPNATSLEPLFGTHLVRAPLKTLKHKKAVKL